MRANPDQSQAFRFSDSEVVLPGAQHHPPHAASNLRSLPMTFKITLNYGHPCGTCKMGTDPETSVLNENCRSHDIENLYVVDGSFMPTSGGTNPSLTIAANSLRVAEAVKIQLERLN